MYLNNMEYRMGSQKQIKLEFIHFLSTQNAEIDRDKWIESEQAHRDLALDENGVYTDSFRISWIAKNAKKYRCKWENSACKSCQSYNCTDKLKVQDENCPNYLNNIRLRVISQDNKLIDVEAINIDTEEVINRYYIVMQMRNGCIFPVFMEHKDSDE
jgi:hypothetical protein